MLTRIGKKVQEMSSERKYSGVHLLQPPLLRKSCDCLIVRSIAWGVIRGKSPWRTISPRATVARWKFSLFGPSKLGVISLSLLVWDVLHVSVLVDSASEMSSMYTQIGFRWHFTWFQLFELERTRGGRRVAKKGYAYFISVVLEEKHRTHCFFRMGIFVVLLFFSWGLYQSRWHRKKLMIGRPALQLFWRRW